MAAERSLRLVLAGAAGALLLLAGCASREYVDYQRLNRGLVVVLTGIEGRSPFNEEICRGLDEGGVAWAIEIHDWTIPMAGAMNLWDEGRNRDSAARIAQRIVNYQKAFPGRPVVMVGQSGGAGMAVWTLEAMPKDHPVDGAVLLAAALSAGYDLRPALSRSRRGIVNFYSPYDWMMLGLGSTMYGNLDGGHGSAAGRVGFDSPVGPSAYSQLFQVCWDSHLGRHTGYLGGHFDSGNRQFIARVVAPLVLDGQWNAARLAPARLAPAIIQAPPHSAPAMAPGPLAAKPAIMATASDGPVGSR